jgi:hypothetical protein
MEIAAVTARMTGEFFSDIKRSGILSLTAEELAESAKP